MQPTKLADDINPTMLHPEGRSGLRYRPISFVCLIRARVSLPTYEITRHKFMKIVQPTNHRTTTFSRLCADLPLTSCVVKIFVSASRQLNFPRLCSASTMEWLPPMTIRQYCFFQLKLLAYLDIVQSKRMSM